MKKRLLLLVSIFFITGCTVNYDLEIVNDDYTENISLSSFNKITKEDLTWEIPVYKNEEQVTSIKTNKKVNGVVYYDKGDLLTNNVYQYNYSHNFKMEDYYRSYFTNSAFDFVGVFYDDKDEEDNKLITLSTGFDFKVFEIYPETEKVVVNIKTNHRVKNHNADVKDKYTYTWNFEKETKDKSIQLVLYKDKFVLNYNNVFVKTLILIGGIVAFLLGLFIFIYNKSKKNNKL